MTIVPETPRNANPKAFYNLAVDSEVGRHVLKVECHKLDVIRKGFSLIMRVRFPVVCSSHLRQSTMRKICMSWKMSWTARWNDAWWSIWFDGKVTARTISPGNLGATWSVSLRRTRWGIFTDGTLKSLKHLVANYDYQIGSVTLWSESEMTWKDGSELETA